LANESYLQKKIAAPVIKRTLLVPLSSDKGLCGGINSGIVKEVKSIVKFDRDNYRIFSVGEKGTGGLLRPFPDLLVKSVSEVLTPLTFANCSALAHHISLMGEDFDQISIIYNRYKSVVS